MSAPCITDIEWGSFAMPTAVPTYSRCEGALDGALDSALDIALDSALENVLDNALEDMHWRDGIGGYIGKCSGCTGLEVRNWRILYMEIVS